MTITDARTLEDGATLAADLLIIGAGAAGITLACAFAGTPQRVILVESGDEIFAHRTQFLYRGRTAGVPTYPLTHSRFRTFGGSTTRWTGQCARLDPIDFEVRDGIKESGWPFDFAHLAPWYQKAAKVAQVRAQGFESEAWVRAPRAILPLACDEIVQRMVQFSHPRDFGQLYRDELEKAPNVDVLLNANALALTTSHDLTRSSGARLATLSGKRFTCTARATVLAAGGIENPRLLLASNEVAAAGLGNQHDLVGRYFMDHPYLTTGWFEPSAQAYDRGLHVIEDFARAGSEQKAHAAFALDEAVMRREQLTGCAAYFIRQAGWRTGADYHAPGGKALVHLAELLRHQTVPDRHTARHLVNLVRDGQSGGRLLAKAVREGLRPCWRLALRTVLETTPRADSRVSLTRRRDALGMPRVQVDWRINPDDRRGLDRLRQALTKRIERRGLGRLLDDPALDVSGWPPSMTGGKHHIGTTRMHTDPKRGVVGPDLEVHGLAGLYVSGSSVFPTGGWANPTLTIVALTLRLADHLAQRLAGRPGTTAGIASSALDASTKGTEQEPAFSTSHAGTAKGM